MRQLDVDLKCSWVSDDPTGSTIFRFSPDPGKKSAFWLDKPHGDRCTIASPAVCQVSRVSGGVIVLGGFQLFSNSRSVEVYIQGPDDKNEGYLTTNRGIPAKEEGPDMFKTICVIPGGPRPVIAFKLKLLGLQPAGASNLELRSLKLTARIPDDAPAALEKVPTSDAHAMPNLMGLYGATGESGPLPPKQQTLSTSSNSEILQASDVGAAMAGVSFMVRSTEERITKSFEHGIARIEQSTSLQLRELAFMMRAQIQLVQKQHQLIEAQQIKLSKQSSDIQTLKEQVQILLDMADYEKRIKSDATDVEQSGEQTIKAAQNPMVCDVDLGKLQGYEGASQPNLCDSATDSSYETSNITSDEIPSDIAKHSRSDQRIQPELPSGEEIRCIISGSENDDVPIAPCDGAAQSKCAMNSTLQVEIGSIHNSTSVPDCARSSELSHSGAEIDAHTLRKSHLTAHSLDSVESDEVETLSNGFNQAIALSSSCSLPDEVTLAKSNVVEDVFDTAQESADLGSAKGESG